MAAVHRYEGHCHIRVMGDGIMALLGRAARTRGPCDPRLLRRASDAGTVERYAKAVLRRARGSPSRSASVLNSTRSSCASDGSDLRIDYSAVGQTTSVAARNGADGRAGVDLVSADTLISRWRGSMFR